MSVYRLEHVLLADGWARGIDVHVARDGIIAAIEPAGSRAAGECVEGFVVPGMPNAHSHAFQRAMRGDTEYSRSARDSFWTWRDAMYALANRLQPADLQVIATQLFIEMLKAGYTSVAEFHYLHTRGDGTPYAHDDMLEALAAAARSAGIGLTLLPTLYQSSDFGDAPLREEQLRFELSLVEFLRLIERRQSGSGAASTLRCGAAFHSLRAVSPATIADAAQALKSIDPDMPIHIHIAEQLREVHACRKWTGKRPIELLLEAGLITARWCLVHATHGSRQELDALAPTQACVCVCATTEANLGDGWFDSQRFLRSGGRISIGSDSQASVSPAEELRWIEYEQRLRRRRRAVMTGAAQPHVGTRLWLEAADSGARALGQPVGALRPGARADWLVLDPADPAMAGSAPSAALDRLVFTSAQSAIRDVMVGGRWVVKRHRHELQEDSAASFLTWMRDHYLTIPV